MKKINEKIKNLFSREYNVDLLKIGLTILAYLIIVSIFYAGYEYKKFTRVSQDKKEKFVEYKYFLRVNNGKEIIYFTKELKDLFSVINDIDSINIEFIEYYEGKEILKINNSKNFEIFVNDKKVDAKFFTFEEPVIEDRADIDIIIY
jgi:hypothetical protein